MRKSADMEFMWKSNALGSEHGIFTHLLYHHYSLPEILDDRQGAKCFSSIYSYKKDIQSCLTALEKYVDSIKTGYKTDNILILYGDDISFKDLGLARKQFELIEDLRDNSKTLNIKISLPSEYFKAVMEENKTYKVFEGDFLPYVSEHIRRRPISWTGFYSSRPGLKKRLYEVQSLVRSAEILTGLIENKDINFNEVSVLLHHDAVTGTCQPDTAKDYFVRLERDADSSLEAINKVFDKIKKEAEQEFSLSIPFKVIILCNTLNKSVKKLAKIPVKSEFVLITNKFTSIDSQTLPINGENFVFFEVQMAGLSFATVFLREISYECFGCSTPSTLNKTEEIDNGLINIRFDKGFVESVNVHSNLLFFASSLVKYDGNDGGAYEFRPKVIFI